MHPFNPASVLLGFVVYMLPWLVALLRRHHQVGMVAVLNILLGWTGLGWVIALAIACSAHRAQQPNHFTLIEE